MADPTAAHASRRKLTRKVKSSEKVLPFHATAQTPTLAPATASQASQPPAPPRLLSKHEVLARIPLSYPSLWKRIRAGTFPVGRNLGGKVCWTEEEISEWIRMLPPQKLKAAVAADAETEPA